MVSPRIDILLFSRVNLPAMIKSTNLEAEYDSEDGDPRGDVMSHKLNVVLIVARQELRNLYTEILKSGTAPCQIWHIFPSISIPGIASIKLPVNYDQRIMCMASYIE